MPKLAHTCRAPDVGRRTIGNEGALNSTFRVGEQRHLVTATDQAPDEEIHDALDASVVFRGNGDVGIHCHRNFHGS